MTDNPDTNFKIKDNRSPDTQARVAKMPDHSGESDDVILRACPFCGSDPNILDLDDYAVDEWVVQCGSCLIFMKGETKSAAIAAWNRRTPEPEASAGKWVSCNRENPNFPTNGTLIIFEADKFADDRQDKIVRLRRYSRGLFDPWMRFRRTVRWCPIHIPTPPVTEPASTSAPEPPPPSGNRLHAQ